MRVQTTHGAAPSRNGSGQPPIPVTYGDPWVMEPCELLPPDRFHGPDEEPTDRRALRAQWSLPESETGANSNAVRWRIFSCTAGWKSPPDASELHAALRAADPTARQRTIVRTWLREATEGELVRAWLEEAYSWRELVEAAHRVGYCRNELARFINGFAGPKAPTQP